MADEDLTNPNMQISLSEAQKIDASYEEGEEVTDEVKMCIRDRLYLYAGRRER